MAEKTANETRIPVQTIREVGYESTKNERIGKDAAIRVALEEEKRVQELFRLAELIASRAGRKTVKEGDVRIVQKIMESDIQ